MIALLFALLLPPSARAEDHCEAEAATAEFKSGFEAQQRMDTDEALAAYGRCLALEPSCVPCQYEIGWTYWSLKRWDDTITAWDKTLALDPGHASAKQWLPQAKLNKVDASGFVTPTGKYVPIGTTSGPGPVKLTLVRKYQNVYARTTDDDDVFEPDIESPKSARYLSDGSKVYVNSLEGKKTVVYDPQTLEKIAVIEHTFDADDAALFHGETTVFDYPYLRRSPSGDPNQFSGKPVESAFSHHERYLWVPYYRRDFDHGAGSPSAVSIIDTKTDQIVRVMPTGPIPKYVAISPDDHWAAITHWGDNTVALIDISSGDPEKFAYYPERMVVERILPQEGLGANRDAACGFCLRGTVFTPDSKTLLVARMGSGGIAGFDVESKIYLGTVRGARATERHLAISPDGKWLYVSSNKSGYASKIALADVVTALRGAGGERVELSGFIECYVGGGARTLEVSADGRYLFVAVNVSAEVVVVDAETMKVVARVRSDAHTVGLDVRPDGKQVFTTSQGREGGGGNSVNVFRVDYEAAPTP